MSNKKCPFCGSDLKENSISKRIECDACGYFEEKKAEVEEDDLFAGSNENINDFNSLFKDIKVEDNELDSLFKSDGNINDFDDLFSSNSVKTNSIDDLFSDNSINLNDFDKLFSSEDTSLNDGKPLFNDELKTNETIVNNDLFKETEAVKNDLVFDKEVELNKNTKDEITNFDLNEIVNDHENDKVNNFDIDEISDNQNNNELSDLNSQNSNVSVAEEVREVKAPVQEFVSSESAKPVEKPVQAKPVTFVDAATLLNEKIDLSSCKNDSEKFNLRADNFLNKCDNNPTLFLKMLEKLSDEHPEYELEVVQDLSNVIIDKANPVYANQFISVFNNFINKQRTKKEEIRKEREFKDAINSAISSVNETYSNIDKKLYKTKDASKMEVLKNKYCDKINSLNKEKDYIKAIDQNLKSFDKNLKGFKTIERIKNIRRRKLITALVINILIAIVLLVGSIQVLEYREVEVNKMNKYELVYGLQDGYISNDQVDEIYEKIISEHKNETVYIVTGTKGLLFDFHIPNDIVRIPESYKGIDIIGIDPGAFCYTNIDTLILPNSLNYITTSAFEGCCIDEIIVDEKVNHLPENLIYLGSYAFSINDFEELVVYDNLVYIDNHALDSNSNIKINFTGNSTKWNSINDPNNSIDIEYDTIRFFINDKYDRYVSDKYILKEELENSNLSDALKPSYYQKDHYIYKGFMNKTNNKLVFDENGNYVYTDSIESDVHLIPKYEAINYTVTYDLNGGSIDKVMPNTINHDMNIDFSEYVPVKTGYTFEGWLYENSDEAVLDATDVVRSGKIVAKYTANDYYVAFGNVDISDYKVTFDENFYLYVAPKTGYTFVGYYTEQNGNGIKLTDQNGNSLNPYNYARNITVYAHYTPNVYNLTFNADGGSVNIDNKDVTYDANYLLPSPTRRGYKFEGWYTNQGSLIANSGKWNYTEGYALTARWSKITYTITYDLDGGVNAPSNPSSYNVTSSITLAAPTKTGYTFTGWTGTDLNGNTMNVSFSNCIGARTYTANWEANTNVITFDANGGTVDIEELVVTYDDEFTLPTPTRTGYTFMGWYCDAVQLTDGVWQGFDDMNLVASWEANEYNITYNDVEEYINEVTVTYNYNYSGSVDNTVTLMNGETLSYPSVPTRAGYAFTGWYTTADCTSEYTFSGDITEDMTLYAGWTNAPYTTTNTSSSAWYVSSDGTYFYSTNKGHSTSSTYKITAQVDMTVTFDYGVSSESGYDCLYIKKNGTTLVNISGSRSYSDYVIEMATGDYLEFIYTKDGSYSDGSDYGYISNFSVRTYTSYASTATANCATEEGFYHSVGHSETITYTYGEEFTLITPIRIGYTFNGWYNGEELFESGTWIYTSDITLSPRWTEGEYYITYNTDGGSLVDSSYVYVETYKYASPEIVLPDLVKTGHTFGGWYYEEDFSGSVVTSIPSGSYGDRELYAKFTANNYTITSEGDYSYTVTFNSNGGTVVSSQTITPSNNKIIIPTAPTKSGYVFAGWYSDEELTELYDFSSDINSDMTLYAKWESPYYTSYYSASIIDPSAYDSTNYLSQYIDSYSSSSSRYRLSFTVNETNVGTSYYYNIYYRQSYSSSTSYRYYIWIYNETTDTTILNTTVSYSSSYNYYSFQATKGDVISIYLYDYTYSTYANIYFAGFDSVKIGESTSLETDVTFGESYTLPVFEKNGYTFDGYYTEENGLGTKLTDGEGNSLVNYNYPNDLTVYPYYIPNTNVISFDANGGTVDIEELVVTYDESYTLPIPTLRGYEFTGWYNGSELYTDGVWNSLEDVSLTATWSLKNYNISYNLDGGVNDYSNPNSYNINSNFTLVDPTKNGYTFTGWMGTDLTEPTMAVEITDCVGDREYTATWEANTNVITFDANGGTVDIEELVVIYDDEFTLPTPTRTGYTFVGWYHEAVLYTDGIWNLTSDLALTAEWDANEYNITYNDVEEYNNSVTVTYNYNYSGSVDNTVTLMNGETLSYPSVPTRDGYAFTGWYTTADCTSEYTFSGEITEDMTLYAGWTNDAYTTTNTSSSAWYVSSDGTYFYSTNKGHGSSSKYMITAQINMTVTFDYNVSSESNYDWLYIKKNGTQLVKISGSQSYYDYVIEMTTGDYLEFSYTKDGSASNGNDYGYISNFSVRAYTSYASTATVNCETEEGFFHSVGHSETITYTYGEEFTLITPIRIGYTFNGWYNGEDLFESGTWTNTSNIALNPLWTKDVYSITYEDNEGTLVDPTYVYTNTYEIDSSTITLPILSKSGYTFNGWCTDEELTSIPIMFIVTGTYGDIELYAKFTAENYTITNGEDYSCTVTFNSNGGSDVSSQTITSTNNKILIPTAPTKSGYVFAGWYSDEELTELYDFSSDIDSDLTLYAKWESPYYTSYYGARIIDPSAYDSSYSLSQYISNSSSSSNRYRLSFTVNETNVGTSDYYNIYYRQYYTNSTSYRYYIWIYNETTDTTILSNAYVSYGSSYYNCSFQATKGDVISIYLYYYTYSTYADIYFTGFDSVQIGESPSLETDVTFGESYTLPVFEKNGYTFDGYYTEANGLGTKLTDGEGNSLVNYNYPNGLTVYPYYTLNTYNISYDLDDGTLVDPAYVYSNTYTYESSEIILPELSKTGYTFNGWYFEEDFSGSVVTSIPSGSYGDIELYAKFTGNYYDILVDGDYPYSYTVTFESNGGSNVSSQTITSTNNKILIPTAPTKSSYVFAGWYSDEELTELYDFSSDINSDMTLYAKWESPYYTSYYSASIIDPSAYDSTNYLSQYISSSSTSSKRYRLSFTVNETNVGTSDYYNIYYRQYYTNSTSYRYYIWIYNETTDTTILSNGYVSYSSSYYYYSFQATKGDVISIYLYDYSNSTYADIYFEGFDAIVLGESTNPYIPVQFNNSFALEYIEKNGYTFDGYYTEANGLGTKLTDGEGNSLANYNYPNDLTVYPYYTLNTYNISYDLDDGTLVDPAYVYSNTYTYESSEIILPELSKTGYTFNGWYFEEDFSGSVVTSIPSGSYGDIELYAKFTVNEYTLTIDAGTAYISYKVDYVVDEEVWKSQIVGNAESINYEIPTKSGYVFSGWYSDATLTTLYDFTSEINSNISIYSGWIECSETTVYRSNSTYNYIYINAGTTTRVPYVPLTSETVTLQTTGALDTLCNLYDSEGNLLASADSGIDGENFSLTYTVTAGTMYYVEVYGAEGQYGFVTLEISGSSYPASTGINIGQQLLTMTIVYGDTFELPYAKEEGKTFNGWLNGVDSFTSGTWTYTSDITITPSWS